ncbi:hypothetical protein JTF08_13760 [Micrococcaceae bacterium RIT802]|nr:hypothetical protein [Micrococcaceae bacterium RIT 802]
MSWRYYLQALPSREWIDKDLPLTSVQVTTACNAPASISGNVPVEYGQLKLEDGSLAVREWGCLLVAEQDGHDPVVGIVDLVKLDGESLRLEAGGFTMYPTGTPWTGPDFAGVQVDPLDMVRKIWDHLQSFPDGDLGVVVDATTSPVRIGKPEETTEFTTSGGDDVSFESGPFRLARWTTDDLGKTIADLAEATPFQYQEHTTWDGEDLTHRLQLGYKTIGTRKHNLRFEIGVNVTATPAIEEGDYASEVLMFGTGEGRKKVAAQVTKQTGRLRRVHVETDKALTSKRAATDAARPILNALAGGYRIDSLEVIEHESAPFGAFGPGDEIRVQGDAGWADLDTWVRIDEMTKDADTGGMSLKVVTV